MTLPSFSSQKAARWAGILFLAAIVFYASGSAIAESAVFSEMDWEAYRFRTGLGAVVMMFNSLVVIGIGALLLPQLLGLNPFVSYLYLGVRITEGALLAAGAAMIAARGVIAEAAAKSATPENYAEWAFFFEYANLMAYNLGMVALGAGSLFFCVLLLRARLAPAWMMMWGLGGYALLGLGAAGEVLGQPYGIMLAIPGGLFELAFGVWLIVKGLPEPKHA